MSLRHGGRQPHLAPRARLTAAPEEILARAPLKQALDQMEPGDPDFRRFLRTLAPHQYHSQRPLPVTGQLGHGERDYAGLKIGRLTVVGRLDERANTGGARWLVRCACSIYETRRARAIGGTMGPDAAMCCRCRYVLRLRRRAAFDLHGVWPDDNHGVDHEIVDLVQLAMSAPINLSGPPTPPDPNDKGNRGKGDRAAQRRRRRWRGLR